MRQGESKQIHLLYIHVLYRVGEDKGKQYWRHGCEIRSMFSRHKFASWIVGFIWTPNYPPVAPSANHIVSSWSFVQSCADSFSRLFSSFRYLGEIFPPRGLQYYIKRLISLRSLVFKTCCSNEVMAWNTCRGKGVRSDSVERTGKNIRGVKEIVHGLWRTDTLHSDLETLCTCICASLWKIQYYKYM